MSVQVAKSTSGTNPTVGRRTPLTLSGSAGKSSKTQSSSEPEKNTSNTDSTSNASVTTNSKIDSKNEKNESSATDLKKAHDKSDTKNVNNEKAAENTSNAKDKGSDDKRRDDKKKDKDSLKKDDKKQENGLNDNKEGSKTNGHKDEGKKPEKGGEKNEKSSGVKENLRQKDIKENKEKDVDQKKSKEEKPAENKKAVDKKLSGKNEDKDQSLSKKKADEVIDLTKKEVDKEHDMKKKSRKEPETLKKDEKKSVDSVKEREEEPSKISTNQQANKSSITIPEKDTKGFDGDEMESLIFEPESDNNGGPTETSTPGKILKINQEAPSSFQRSTYEYREFYDKYESISNKEDKPDMSNVATTPLERPQFTSYRAISGRRSLRPVKEYSFQSTYRESYRKINTELDYTSSSMNVTVGSEIPNESSFSIFGRGKKRERTPPVSSSNDSNIEVQMDVELSPKSPKRPKLDFSGIIGFVASPVTMLRAKLSRTKLQCSTPNGKVTSTTKDDEDGVENVSLIASEEIASKDIGDASEDVDIKEVELVVKDIDDEFKNGGDVDISENLDDFKKPQQIVSSMESVNKRRMCNVM